MVQPSVPPSATPSGQAVLRYALSSFHDSWLIPEEEVPESAWHDGCVELLRLLLVAWVKSAARDAAVFRDIAIQVRRERPKVGWNPDLCLVEPAPADAAVLESMRLWDHAPPKFAFEAVSPNHPVKDYAVVPEKCALAGVTELCVFDPLLAGPRSQGGPWLLQLWRRASDGGFERVHAGESPARSEVLGAFLVPDRASRSLRIAGRADGGDPWFTREEIALTRAQEALAREQEASKREQEALRRLAELEAKLRERG
jgi:Uma2 family endonuclease